MRGSQAAVDLLMLRFGQLANGKLNSKYYDDANSMEASLGLDACSSRLSKLFIRKMINVFLVLNRQVSYIGCLLSKKNMSRCSGFQQWNFTWYKLYTFSISWMSRGLETHDISTTAH
jgi:hypothetical protein